jgi:hypothetical protein
MFTWINKQGVSSSDGFVVQMTGRFTMEYREGSRVLVLEIDNGNWGGGPSIALTRPSDLERWGKSGLSISKSDQDRVRLNIKEALAFQGLTLEPY